MLGIKPISVTNKASSCFTPCAISLAPRPIQFYWTQRDFLGNDQTGTETTTRCLVGKRLSQVQEVLVPVASPLCPSPQPSTLVKFQP